MGDCSGPGGAVHISWRLITAILERHQEQMVRSTGALPHMQSVAHSKSRVAILGCQVQVLARVVVRNMATKMLKITKMGLKVQRGAAQ